MCWMCENPDGTFDEFLDHIQDCIMSHGWAVLFVEHDNRPLAYTAGLSDHGLPELLITGLKADVALVVLNSLAHQIVDDGTRLAPAMHIDYEDRFLIEVVEVEHPDVHLKVAVAVCGAGVRAVQLVWADDRGRWPWEPRWAHGRRRQPVLGVRSEP